MRPPVQLRRSGLVNAKMFATSKIASTRIDFLKSEELAPDLYPNFSFTVSKTDANTKARLGTISTPHGEVETPNFIFCATRGAMKSITTEQLRAEGTQIMLSNTYHMMLCPGPDIVEQNGGLQKFTGWRGPMFTDSGGYQIFSMGYGSVSNEIKGNRCNSDTERNKFLQKIDEEGATFRSYVTGQLEKLTPERSIEVQRKLGADLVVVFDECTPFNVDKNYTTDSMRRSHRWALRSLEEFKRTNTNTQALYGIIQGGTHLDLRDESTDFVNRNNFFGSAIGGSLGDSKRTMHDIVAYTRGLLRDDRPVHLLGIGGVVDIFHGVRQGIDTFDCVSPTRLGRHGGALVMAAHWDEELHPLVVADCTADALKLATNKAEKMTFKANEREASRRRLRSLTPMDPATPELAIELLAIEEEKQRKVAKEASRLKKSRSLSDHMKFKTRLTRCDPRPIDPTCDCYTCKNFSRAYLHHCFAAGEMVGGTLVRISSLLYFHAIFLLLSGTLFPPHHNLNGGFSSLHVQVTIHNVHFMNRLMKSIRYKSQKRIFPPRQPIISLCIAPFFIVQGGHQERQFG